MSEPFERSVTAWISDLKRGDETAAERLWARYFDRLVNTARRKFGSAPRRVADEEDVAISVFHGLCKGAAEGRFTELKDRDDLWRLLTAIAAKKVVDQKRRQTSQKRGGGTVRGESVMHGAGTGDGPAGIEQFMAEDPTPEFVAMLDEENERLLGLLRDDVQRSIARRRMEGCSNEEIAEEMGVSLRTVERKLNLIRETWAEEVER